MRSEGLAWLVGIINKTLIRSPGERLAISNKWVGLDTDMDYGLSSISCSWSALIVVVSSVLLWIARLRKEIRHGKQIQLDLEKT